MVLRRSPVLVVLVLASVLLALTHFHSELTDLHVPPPAAVPVWGEPDVTPVDQLAAAGAPDDPSGPAIERVLDGRPPVQPSPAREDPPFRRVATAGSCITRAPPAV